MAGMLVIATGLAFLSRAPDSGHIEFHVFPGLALLGLGTGLVISPLMIGAMQGLPPEDAGLASGLIGTSSCMGRVIGIAVLTSAAAARTNELLDRGFPLFAARNEGYHTAFYIGAGSALGTAIFVLVLLFIERVRLKMAAKAA